MLLQRSFLTYKQRVNHMSKYIIEGGKKARGEIVVNGAKNSALPILSASVLCNKCIIHNCPGLTDVNAALNILEHLGSKYKIEGNTVILDNSNIVNNNIPDDLMREMRSSIVFMGAVISRCKGAEISYPGGCELGPRPIDMHISAMKKFGVSIEEKGGYLQCKVKDKLKGCVINLPFPSVGATENAMIAAVNADGNTTIYNGAREPEILDLADFLNKCGAKISIDKTGTIYIEGVKKLCGEAEHTVISDRVEAATFLCAAAVTKGEIMLKKARAEHLTSVLPVFEEMGCFIKSSSDGIYIKGTENLKAPKLIRTMPYPGFPTDMQSPLMSVASVSEGTSVFVENIFESRYKHVAELTRMGANIKTEGKVAIVTGVPRLHGAVTRCTDLRGGAAICIAALNAEGITQVNEISHIERGYENFDGKLKALGLEIKRER